MLPVKVYPEIVGLIPLFKFLLVHLAFVLIFLTLLFPGLRGLFG